MPAALSVSIVTHAPDLALLAQTLDSLRRALHAAQAQGTLAHADVSVIDNGPGGDWSGSLRALLGQTFAGTPWAAAEVVTGHGNVGYGRGHNLALMRSTADYHLVLNPDVVMQDDAVCQAIAFMQSHRDVDLLAPLVTGADGKAQYLCKRYPALIDLAVRGFAPQPIQRAFRRRLERYEMKSETDSGEPFDAPLASGCCMFLRCAAGRTAGGFCDDYFMYFEDFDLSLRMGGHGRLVCVPQVRIVHHGGNAAAKGEAHIRMFLRSMVTFYNRNGWKLW